MGHLKQDPDGVVCDPHTEHSGASPTFSRSVMVRSPSAAVDDTLTVNAAAVDHEGSREGRVLSIYWIREAFDRFSDGGYS